MYLGHFIIKMQHELVVTWNSFKPLNWVNLAWLLFVIDLFIHSRNSLFKPELSHALRHSSLSSLFMQFLFSLKIMDNLKNVYNNYEIEKNRLCEIKALIFIGIRLIFPLMISPRPSYQHKLLKLCIILSVGLLTFLGCLMRDLLIYVINDLKKTKL